MIRRIVIVGGGSAGWLTAGLIAADHQGTPLHITLIESPDIAPIGVGEGTWPSMRDTLRRIGVSEADFFRECDAAFKQGSRFNHWRGDHPLGSDRDYYFHPFVLPQGYGEVNLPQQWQAQHPDTPFADLVSFQPHLCVNGRAPKQASTPEFASVANYGYHLDAGKFGVFLRKHCLEKLGVHHVPDNVVGITSHDNGDIAALRTQAHGALEAELFIDCTGMQSLLLGKHYEVPFISQKHVLYNDSALAVQIPYPAADHPIASQTSSTAQSAGWIWDIGLPTRRGVGHVYSGAHIGDDQAEAELRRYISATGGPQDIPSPRKLSFNPGYRARFWHRNCVAIGLSAGFIEPLEASALALVEMSAAMVSDELPATRAAMDIVARRFNDAFTYRWERVIDFLKLHYVLSRRRDSDYWRDNTAAVPERLNDLLTLWRHRAPSRNDFNRIEEVFPSASYQYVLYGMGFRSEYTHPQPQQAAQADHYFREAAALTRKMLGALPDNRALINHITQRHHA
ncbi:tryptophan halogenase family protein [Duganella sp. HH101]|uniref:tryptophan halogenase family protein n=1 Tax=Duganella sp. HH101 TaxID=1781066 RepID=UPI000874C811|nr:tryptophan halogenase family protein [Duganella sp. HH101]OFA00533.1 flavin-dependent tryptophan halogenase RebH [Duganella sp. HH101]